MAIDRDDTAHDDEGAAGLEDEERWLRVLHEERLRDRRAIAEFVEAEFDGTKITLYVAGENGVIERTALDEWLEKQRARKVEGN